MSPEFKDVREQSRRYIYPDNQIIEIRDVIAIAVSPSGTHRLTTASDKKYIVAPGWRVIEFRSDDWSF